MLSAPCRMPFRPSRTYCLDWYALLAFIRSDIHAGGARLMTWIYCQGLSIDQCYFLDYDSIVKRYISYVRKKFNYWLMWRLKVVNNLNFQPSFINDLNFKGTVSRDYRALVFCSLKQLHMGPKALLHIGSNSPRYSSLKSPILWAAVSTTPLTIFFLVTPYFFYQMLQL
jgi:hypothetical protein